MNLLSDVLYGLEEIEYKLKNEPNLSQLAAVKQLIQTIEETENNQCADCIYDSYYPGSLYEPPNSTCGCKECEYEGSELPMWYGGERCEHYSNAAEHWDNYEKEMKSNDEDL